MTSLRHAGPHEGCGRESAAVLVIHEDREVHELIAWLAAARDWTVESCFDARTGIERILTSPFSLAVTDARMPGFDWLPSALRTACPRLKVLVLTAENSRPDVIRCLSTGVYSYFSKPFSASAVHDMALDAIRCSSREDDIEMRSTLPDWLSFRVRCRIETADRLVQFLHELNSDIPMNDREPMLTAFRELLVNGIEHGGNSNPEKWVQVSNVRTARSILYHLQDPGNGFSFSDLAHSAIRNPPDLPCEHAVIRDQQGLRPGGFGILLARSSADEVHYSEKGNEVLMVKYRDNPR